MSEKWDEKVIELAKSLINCQSYSGHEDKAAEALKAYMKEGTSDKLEYIPLVLAGWLRYLMAKDDNGNDFDCKLLGCV